MHIRPIVLIVHSIMLMCRQQMFKLLIPHIAELIVSHSPALSVDVNILVVLSIIFQLFGHFPGNNMSVGGNLSYLDLIFRIR